MAARVQTPSSIIYVKGTTLPQALAIRYLCNIITIYEKHGNLN